MSFNMLPIELVRKILQHATEVPGLFDACPGCMTPDEDMQRAITAVKAVWPTKAALQLVSRAVCGLVEEFLYEAVLATDLDSFHQLLARLDERKTLSGSHPGHCVKWLALKFDVSKMSSTDRNDSNNLWGALSRFPNLVALCVSPEERDDPERLYTYSATDHVELSPEGLRNISTTYGPSLRKIYLSARVHLPLNGLVSSLGYLQRIESMVVHGPFHDFGRSERYELMNFRLALPTLHTLHVNHMRWLLQHMASWELPGLKRLWVPESLVLEEPWPWGTFFDETFLCQHGKNLLILEVEWHWNQDAWENWPARRPYSLVRMPNLRHLLLHCPGDTYWLSHGLGAVSLLHHEKLEEIITYGWAPLNDAWRGIYETDSHVQSMVQAVQAGRFPSLRKICSKNCSVFPAANLEPGRGQLSAHGVEWEVQEWTREDDASPYEWK